MPLDLGTTPVTGIHVSTYARLRKALEYPTAAPTSLRHRVQAVRLFLEGHEPMEIARQMYHALSSIENYLTTFGRIVLLADKGHGNDEIAFLVGRSSALVAAYRELARQFANKRTAQVRFHEITQRVEALWNQGKKARFAGKKGGTQP